MSRNSPVHLLTITALGITLGSAGACSSNSDQRAPTLAEGGASGRASTGKSGGGGSDEAGSAGENGEGGTAAEAGAAGSAAGEGGEGGAFEEGAIVPVTPGACSETATWSNVTPLDGISTEAEEQ